MKILFGNSVFSPRRDEARANDPDGLQRVGAGGNYLISAAESLGDQVNSVRLIDENSHLTT